MDLAELFQRRVVYELPGMDGVRVHRDVTYKHADSIDLRMDVYSPPDQEGPLPAAILVAGDARPEIIKDSKDWGVYISFGQLVALSGLAAVTFNHRSTESLTRLADVAQDAAADRGTVPGGSHPCSSTRIAEAAHQSIPGDG